MASKGKSKPQEEPTCTTEELMNIITAPSGGMVMLPSNGHDEVFPGIYIGEESSARNTYLLQRLGVTHVLNTAQGPKDNWHVNISPVYYKKSNIQQLSIAADDIMNFNLAQYFDKCNDFIDEALKEGKVLVHCRQGVSRSATVVLAYLMSQRHMTAQEALRHVREKREVCPNDGFLQQLCDLNDRLSSEGHFKNS